MSKYYLDIKPNLHRGNWSLIAGFFIDSKCQPTTIAEQAEKSITKCLNKRQ